MVTFELCLYLRFNIVHIINQIYISKHNDRLHSVINFKQACPVQAATDSVHGQYKTPRQLLPKFNYSHCKNVKLAKNAVYMPGRLTMNDPLHKT